MTPFDKFLLIVHYFGIAMGFATTISGIVMSVLMGRAEPADKAVLSRFMPMMSRVGTFGLLLIWASGMGLVFTVWQGFKNLPETVNYKFGAVICLTIAVILINVFMGRAERGDAAAAAKIQIISKFSALFAVLSLIMAVVVFK